MNERHPATAPAQRNARTALGPLASLRLPPAGKRPARTPTATRWRGACPLALILGLLVAVTIFALTLAGAAQSGPSSSAPSIRPVVSVRPAKIRSYPISPPDAGLMLPAVDRQGNVWFGEMATNRLTRLDPRTGAISTWVPPHGEDGIMGTTVDGQGTLWFAEENANYLGRFDPLRQAFSVFSLGRAPSQRVGLQDVQFDASGNLWFTETVAGRLGRFDPASGTFQTWALPPSAPGVPSSPFGLAIAPDRAAWFGTYSGGVVGRLDPRSGRVRLFRLASPAEQIYSLAADARGRIWYTDLQFGRLGMIDPATGKVSELQVPAALGNPEDLHSLILAHGDLWFTSSGANALVRYSPADQAFTFFRLSEPGSTPFGLALGPGGTLWFTAGGNPVNYVGAMTIPS